jgi:ketosteroid isomerase-like protein
VGARAGEWKGECSMRNLPMAIVVVVAFFASGAGGSVRAQHDAIADPMVAEQAAVAALLDHLMQALSRGDLDQVESLHLYGPKFTRFDDMGLARQEGDEARLAERQGLSAIESFKGKVVGLKVDVFGVAAVATFVLEYDIRVGGTPISSKARSTMVFANDGARWRIVHEHLSPLARQG